MSSLLDMLGYVGDSLDKPGRAVRGLLSGNAREGLAAIPFSDAMGLTDQAERVSGKDLLGKMGITGDGLGTTLAGIGTEIATDPLSWLGVGLGAKLGSKAGSAAMARGPNYATSADDLARMAGHADEAALRAAKPYPGMPDMEPKAWLRDRGLNELLESPGGAAAMRELPPNSQYLGAGMEAVTFRTPTGDVLRLGAQKAGQPGRPVAETMLQPTRTVDFPGVRAERVPFAEDVGQVSPEAVLALKGEAGEQGLNLWDRLGANYGRHGGRDVAIDPGAMTATSRYTGQFNPVTSPSEPGALMRSLMNLGGGDEAVRAAINAGRRDPGMTLPLARLGGASGATLGGLGRL